MIYFRKFCIQSETRFDFLKDLVSSVPELQGDMDLADTEVPGLLTSELRVEHALSERLSLQLVGRGTYDTDPAANSGRHDLQLVSALAVRF